MLLNSSKYTFLKTVYRSSIKRQNMLTNNSSQNIVINNYVASFTINKVTGNYGDVVYGYYPNCDFMANYIPFETQGRGCTVDGESG